MNYSVIYGDTDSIMVDTMTSKLDEAVSHGMSIRDSINEQFNKRRGERAILEVDFV